MPRVNKSKLIASAQKHVSKGNLDKALKDYQKILKADANDTSVRLKVGDLYERLGDRAKSMVEYRKVAATFTAQGFYSKAIAVLKRIQTAEPDLVEIHLELAELNEKMGLLSEVVHHYQLAANVFDRKGEKRHAIDILKKVGEVGPPNLERKVKVAELYYKEGFPEAGYEQFVSATAELDERSPELLEVVKRMCKACPDNPDLIVRLGSLHLALGDPKRAIGKFEEARAIDESARTLELLGEAKLHLELLGDAKLLFEKSSHLYEEKGDSGKARDLAARINEISEVILDGPAALLENHGTEDTESEASSAAGDSPAEVADEAPPEAISETPAETAPPTPEDASETPEEPPAEEADAPIEGAEETFEVETGEAAAAGDAQEDDEDDLSEDERLEVAYSEAEVYQKYGKIEGAERTLEKVARRFPDRHEPRMRLKEIHEANGAWAKVAGQCRKLSQIASSRGDEFRASRFLSEAKEALARLAGVAEPGSDTGEAGTNAAEAPPIAAPDEPAAPDAPGRADQPGDTALDLILEDEDAGDVAAPARPEASLEESEADPPPDPAAAIEDMLIRSDAFAGGGDGAVEAPSTPLPAPAGPELLDDLEIVIDDEGANPGGAPLSAEADATPAAHAAGEEETAEQITEDAAPDIADDALSVDLEEAEFYASRGMIAEALAIYTTAREEAPDDEAIRARHEALLAMEDVAPNEADEVELAASDLEALEDDDAGAIPEDLREEDVSAAAPEEETPVAPESPGEGEEVFVLEEAEDDEDDEEVPASWDWGATDGRLASSEGPDPDNEAVDASEAAPVAQPGREDAGESADESAFDLRAELDDTDDLEDEVGDVSDATEALSDLVGELKDQESGDAQTVDSQTHYDLGIAYKEMALLDDAIRELTLAAGDPERRIDCCAVLGICYRQQGRPEEAVRMLEECLGDGSIAAENAPGLLYEMGIAHEELGDRGKALDWYERLVDIDPDFEDVKTRISALRRGGADDADDPAGGGLDEIDKMLDGLADDE
ncbi:MAG: tetratricopeptide repeat protein [Myxococcota bacterium]